MVPLLLILEVYQTQTLREGLLHAVGGSRRTTFSSFERRRGGRVAGAKAAEAKVENRGTEVEKEDERVFFSY